MNWNLTLDVVRRSCAPAGTAVNCVKQTINGVGEGEACICQGDLCNGSGKTTGGLAAVALIATAAVLMFH